MPARSSALKCSTAHAQAVKAQERWLIVNLLQDILVNVWHVEYTDEFWLWWLGLTEDQREALDDCVTLLAEKGPNLKRPVVGGIRASRHPNMKELRVSEGGSLRVLFAFDPRRHAILLLGGCKSGRWNAWYRWAVPEADGLYDTYLGELRAEGLLEDGP